MPRPWSDDRKKRLTALQAAGRSADEIAKALGLRRDQVMARIELMASWERNRAMYDKALEKRAQAQDARAQKAIATMKKAIARGMARNEAMFEANLAGATWREIGEQFGISAVTAGVAARSSRKRAGPAKTQAAKRRRRVSRR
jgi:hypothetical protein